MGPKQWAALGLGVALITAILLLPLFSPKTSLGDPLVMRTLLALAAALVTAAVLNGVIKVSNNLVTASGAVGVFVLVFAFGPGGKENPPAETRLYIVRGTVRDLASDVDLSGAKVRVSGHVLENDLVVATNPDGLFSFVVTTDTVKARHPLQVEVSADRFRKMRFQAPLDSLQRTNPHEIKLQSALPPHHTLSGQVRDVRNGRGLGGVQISGGTLNEPVLTDGNGRFKLEVATFAPRLEFHFKKSSYEPADAVMEIKPEPNPVQIRLNPIPGSGRAVSRSIASVANLAQYNLVVNFSEENPLPRYQSLLNLLTRKQAHTQSNYGITFSAPQVVYYQPTDENAARLVSRLAHISGVTMDFDTQKVRQICLFVP